VTQLVVPATQASHFQRQIKLCQQNPHWHLALGLHPYFSHVHSSDHLPLLRDAIVAHQPVAVGEIGLDFHLDTNSKGFSQVEQEAWLLAQLDLAQQHSLPVIVHCRKANDRLAQLLRRHAFAEGGIVHAFSGSQQQALAFTQLGFKIGLGGTLTYDRAQAVKRLAIALPLADIVLETDAPDMPMAGSDRALPNRPDYLPRVFQQLASLRPESIEKIAQQIYANTQQVLRLG
jgi:TatD DNase family protein